MIAFVRKNLTLFISKQTALHSRSPVLSLHSFSTSTESQLGIRPALFDILVHKHDFPPELAYRVVAELPYGENPEKADSVLSFFKQTGFSRAQLVKMVRCRPRLLAGSLEDSSFKSKIKIFQEFGFSSDDICKLVSSNPAILHLSLDNNIVPSLSVLKDLFGSNIEAIRVLKNCPRLLTVNVKNSLIPNVEFLKSCGIPVEHILIVVSHFPGPFTMKPEVLRKSAEKAKEMGLNASSKNFTYAVITIAAVNSDAWELKLQAFRDTGFSDSDILTMFRKVPRTLLLSMEKINKIKELLLATGKFNMLDIVHNPLSLQFSIEKRYDPRLQVLGILEGRNLIEKWPDLQTIYRLPDDTFFERFIRPYVDKIGDVDIPKCFARVMNP